LARKSQKTPADEMKSTAVFALSQLPKHKQTQIQQGQKNNNSRQLHLQLWHVLDETKGVGILLPRPSPKEGNKNTQSTSTATPTY